MINITYEITDSPSKIAKSFGLKSLKQVSDIAKVSIQTLINWHKNKPDLFIIVLKGVCSEVEAAKHREALGVSK